MNINIIRGQSEVARVLARRFGAIEARKFLASVRNEARDAPVWAPLPKKRLPTQGARS